MSYEDSNATIDVTLFGLQFQATRRQQRELWMKLSTSKESREWGIARNLVNILCGQVAMDEQRRLAEHMENCDVAMTKLAAKLIDELCNEAE